MSEFSYGEIISSCIEKLRAMVDSNTIIGEAIKTDDGITIIPVSKISFGIVSGGGDIARKERSSSPALGLGSGMNIQPVAFLVVSGGSVRVIPVGDAPGTTVDRIIELVPDVIDRVTTAFKSGRAAKKETDKTPPAETEIKINLGGLEDGD